MACSVCSSSLGNTSERTFRGPEQRVEAQLTQTDGNGGLDMMTILLLAGGVVGAYILLTMVL